MQRPGGKSLPEGVRVIARVPNNGNLDNNDLLIYFELVTIIFTVAVSFLRLGVRFVVTCWRFRENKINDLDNVI